MPIPAVPWWPPIGSHEITGIEVRQLFAYLRTVTPPVVEDARWRIREHVGDEPIEVDYIMAGQLVGKRLGTIDVVTLIWVSARAGADTVSVTIGLRKDGRLATQSATVGEDPVGLPYTELFTDVVVETTPNGAVVADLTPGSDVNSALLIRLLQQRQLSLLSWGT